MNRKNQRSDPGNYARTLRATAPRDRLLIALEIRHPAVREAVRVVNGLKKGEDRYIIEGHPYIGLHFTARLADDVEGRAPTAELVIDNIGRELTRWIEAADGGRGASVRIMQILASEATPEWEMTLDITGVRVDQRSVSAQLGFDPLLDRPAVRLRFDPETAPGLF